MARPVELSHNTCLSFVSTFFIFYFSFTDMPPLEPQYCKRASPNAVQCVPYRAAAAQRRLQPVRQPGGGRRLDGTARPDPNTGHLSGIRAGRKSGQQHG